MVLGKVLRTAQSHFPVLKPAKDALYRNARRILRVPHERDFGVLRYLQRTPEEVLIDVGANHGQSIESMRLFRPDVPIVAFEASRDLALTLQRRYARNARVRIEHQGLGDEPGHLILHVPSYRGFVYDGLASLDRAAAESWLGPHTIFGFRRDKLAIAEQPCEILTLDSFDLTPAFIKIDVQGLEYRVLLGARRTIERCRPAVLVEDYETDPRLPPLMRALGYGVFHVEAGDVAAGSGPGPNTLLLPDDKTRFSGSATRRGTPAAKRCNPPASTVLDAARSFRSASE